MLDSINVKLLFTIHADLSVHRMPNREGGHDLFCTLHEGSFEGDNIRGVIHPTNFTDIGKSFADGSSKSEVNFILSTDDGEEIHIHYLASTIPLRNGSSEPGEPTRRTLNMPFFNTASDKYDWLTKLHTLTTYKVVGVTEDDHRIMQCDVYELFA